MVNAPDSAFDSRNQGMNLRQKFYCIPPRTDYERLVAAFSSTENAKRMPPICLDLAVGLKMIPCLREDLLDAETPHLPHGGKSCFIILRFNGHHHLLLTTRSATSLPWFRRSEGGVIHLDHSGQFITGIPMGHGLANLMTHHPHCLVAFDVHHALRRQHGDATFLPSHEEEHPRPCSYGSSRVVKNSPSWQRGRILT